MGSPVYLLEGGWLLHLHLQNLLLSITIIWDNSNKHDQHHDISRLIGLLCWLKKEETIEVNMDSMKSNEVSCSTVLSAI